MVHWPKVFCRKISRRDFRNRPLRVSPAVDRMLSQSAVRFRDVTANRASREQRPVGVSRGARTF